MLRCIFPNALAVAAIVSAAPAHALPIAPGEVAARWPLYYSDGAYNFHRDPKPVVSGTEVTVWRAALAVGAWKAQGLTTNYQQVKFDCAGRRKMFLALEKLGDDGQVGVNPGVALNTWFPKLTASDEALMKAVCPPA